MKRASALCIPILSLTLLLTGTVYSSSYLAHAEKAPDWRVTGTPEEQLEALVKITPGTSHWMPEIAYRFQTMYWAGKQDKWEFAEYQIEAMEKMMDRVATARTKRAASINIFRENVFGDLDEAVKTQNFEVFEEAVAVMSSECMACHTREGFSYITVPAVPTKPDSIVLD
ncbi:hypothetical protein [Pseudovibrio sp. Ad37]|uniref:hypothetical protein n=1 Tax=Pseudovibrio sp. Ad37 TaxID=989422 RepID=UPI0007B1FF0B|nr:hypothetical protein [Pseudovibrio sp. Ad37]KZL15189.1 hypothetical protein PsAD37_04463 [Pseudovibrio sp. Ad37]